MSRRVERRKALQVLFSVEVGRSDKDFMLSTLMMPTSGKQGERTFTKLLVDGVLEHQKEIDVLIAKYAKDWDISRIGKVELCALRLAIYEMLYVEDIPPVVSINEAIELVRYFNGDQSTKFVNGILDSVYKEKYKEN